MEWDPIGFSMPCSHLKSGYIRVIMSSNSTAWPHAVFTSGHLTSSFHRPSRKPLMVPNRSLNLQAHLHASVAVESMHMQLLVAPCLVPGNESDTLWARYCQKWCQQDFLVHTKRYQQIRVHVNSWTVSSAHKLKCSMHRPRQCKAVLALRPCYHVCDLSTHAAMVRPCAPQPASSSASTPPSATS